LISKLWIHLFLWNSFKWNIFEWIQPNIFRWNIFEWIQPNIFRWNIFEWIQPNIFSSFHIVISKIQTHEINTEKQEIFADNRSLSNIQSYSIIAYIYYFFNRIWLRERLCENQSWLNFWAITVIYKYFPRLYVYLMIANSLQTWLFIEKIKLISFWDKKSSMLMKRNSKLMWRIWKLRVEARKLAGRKELSMKVWLSCIMLAIIGNRKQRYSCSSWKLLEI
jgi:hypothetical protein